MSLNNPGNRPVQIAIAIFICVLIASLAMRCRADELHYAQVSGGSTVIRGQAPVLDLTFAVPAVVAKGASWQFGVTLVGEAHDSEGAYVRNNFAAFGRFVDGFGRFDIGLGLAYLQNVDAFNGSHPNFNLMLGYRLERWPVTLTYNHWSNAGTTQSNLGRDMLLAGWRFQ